MPRSPETRRPHVAIRAAALAATVLLCPAGPWTVAPLGTARAQTATTPLATPQAMQDAEKLPQITGEANPVVASVDGRPIRLNDLSAAMAALPENLRALPFDTLYPVLVDRLVDHQALVLMAKRTGLEEQPEVRREIDAATERVLEGAYLGREAVPKVTDQALRAAYDRIYANRPASDEVRARHILVSTEAEARKVLDELRQGADFAALAKKLSKDPDGRSGGDLGFFRREQVWPAFADLVFALQPGQIAANPIRNEYGWHVVKVEDRRRVPPPSFDEAKEGLRQELLAQAVQQAVDHARGQVIIRRYNLDGTELETGPRFRASVSAEAPPSQALPPPAVLPAPTVAPKTSLPPPPPPPPRR